MKGSISLAQLWQKAIHMWCPLNPPTPSHPSPNPQSNKKSLKVHPFKGRWEKDQNIKRSWLTFADRCHHALALALPRFSPANNPCSALVPAREFNQERWPKTIFSLEILCRPLSSTLLAEKRISIERFSRLFGREFQNKLLKIEAVLKYRGEQKNPLKHILLAMCMQGSLFQAGCYWRILSVNNSHAYCIYLFLFSTQAQGEREGTLKVKVRVSVQTWKYLWHKNMAP